MSTPVFQPLRSREQFAADALKILVTSGGPQHKSVTDWPRDNIAHRPLRLTFSCSQLLKQALQRLYVQWANDSECLTPQLSLSGFLHISLQGFLNLFKPPRSPIFVNVSHKWRKLITVKLQVKRKRIIPSNRINQQKLQGINFIYSITLSLILQLTVDIGPDELYLIISLPLWFVGASK